MALTRDKEAVALAVVLVLVGITQIKGITSDLRSMVISALLRKSDV